MVVNEVTASIIKAAIQVHKELGPGLLESVCQRCMEIELKKMGLQVDTQVPVGVHYDGRLIHEEGFFIDFLVEGGVVVELKSVDSLKDVHKKQLLTYLRLANKQIGLLINFNEALLRKGIVRVANGFQEADQSASSLADPLSDPSAALRET